MTIDFRFCEAACPDGALRLNGDGAPIPLDPELKISPKQAAQFLRSRRSVRCYKTEAVSKEQIIELIDIARFAPSGSNGQPLSWTVISSEEIITKLRQSVLVWARELAKAKLDESPISRNYLIYMLDSQRKGRDPVFRNAPQIVIAHAEGANRSATTDATIAIAYLELAAYSHGLGACWAGFLYLAAKYSPEVLSLLGLPEGHQCLGALMLGYPKHYYARIPRRKNPPVEWR